MFQQARDFSRVAWTFLREGSPACIKGDAIFYILWHKRDRAELDKTDGLLWSREREHADLKEFIEFAGGHCWAQ